MYCPSNCASVDYILSSPFARHCFSRCTRCFSVTIESVVEILKCDHSNESYWAVLSCGAVYCAVQGGSNFWDCGWSRKVWPFKWKLLSSTFLWCCLLCCTRWFQLLRLDEVVKCDHSNERYRAVLSYGAVYYAVQGGSNFWVCGWNPKVWPFKWKLLSSTF